MEAVTDWNTPMKPEEVPMMMGTLPPMGPMAKSCKRVTSPATSMAFCSRLICKSANSPPTRPQALVMMSSGVRFPTNMASTCCTPRGMACRRGSLPSKVKASEDRGDFSGMGQSSLFHKKFTNTSLANWRRMVNPKGGQFPPFPAPGGTGGTGAPSPT